MARIGFGAFLAPHHPIGEHPMLQFRRDLDFAEHLDKLGYDEFWCGEHHSSGWEMIASPEMFLAASAERTKRIKLGTGVVSLPYHHPFNVAQRMVQLDHMSGGRAIFGSGPGALSSDAYALGIDPMVQRDRQDEAIGIIKRLMAGERVTAESSWFTLRDAALQILPLQEEMPFVTASQISPSGMTLAGKHGIGVISIGSLSTEGLTALPTQWGFAEDAAKKHGKTVSRKDWRVLLSWHIAETREKAREEAGKGLMRWHNEYIVGTLQRPGAKPFKSIDDALEQTSSGPGIGRDHRHAGRSGEDHQERDRDVRRARHHRRLRARLGKRREHVPQLGHGRALCHSGDQRLRERPAPLAEACDREPRVVRPRRPGGDGQDHGKRQGCRGARGDPHQPFCRLQQQHAGLREGGGEKGLNATRHDDCHCEMRAAGTTLVPAAPFSI